MRKWAIRIAGALLALVVIAAAVVFITSQTRLKRIYKVPAERVAIPPGPAALARGQHVAIISGCVDCHGPNLGGRVFFENAMIGRFVASNLTGGQGGVGGRFSDADWISAIRHGVRTDGTPLLVMPSKEFYSLSDDDLGALLAYLKSIPAVDGEQPRSSISPMGRVLMLALKDMAILAAERIDHDAPRPTAPAVAVTREYGAYLAARCTGCHGDTLSGGHIPGTPPDWPPASNLTPAPDAAAAVWTAAQFMQTMRTGTTPAGKQLNHKYMPWPVLGQMTDDELQALWLDLQALPAKAYGNR